MPATDPDQRPLPHSEANEGAFAERIIDDAFDRRHTANSILCLLLRPYRMAYAVLDEGRNKITVQHSVYLSASEGLEAYMKDLRGAVAQDDLLHLPFRQTRIAVGTGPSLLVPSPVHGAAPGEHLARQHALSSRHRIWQHALPEMDAVLEASADADLLDYLMEGFHPAHCLHADAVLLDRLQQEVPVDVRMGFAHVEREAVFLCCFEGHRLLFVNRFAIHAKEDFLYYSQLAFQQTGLDPATDPLLILGEAVEDSGLYALADRYFKALRFGRRPKGLRYNRSIREMPSQFNYTLYSLALCGL
jgi:hypothetical protein